MNNLLTSQHQQQQEGSAMKTSQESLLILFDDITSSDNDEEDTKAIILPHGGNEYDLNNRILNGERRRSKKVKKRKKRVYHGKPKPVYTYGYNKSDDDYFEKKSNKSYKKTSLYNDDDHEYKYKDIYSNHDDHVPEEDDFKKPDDNHLDHYREEHTAKKPVDYSDDHYIKEHKPTHKYADNVKHSSSKKKYYKYQPKQQVKKFRKCHPKQIYGQVYYIPVFNKCWQFEMFVGGKLKAKSGVTPPSACNAESGNNGEFDPPLSHFHHLSLEQKSGTAVALFAKGGPDYKGWKGRIIIFESKYVKKLKIIFVQIIVDKKYFVIKVLVPSCRRITPSPTISLQPSAKPSIAPTLVPSVAPSNSPTQTPKPSVQPSEVPSNAPSKTTKPSVVPSDYPTYNFMDDEFVRDENNWYYFYY